TRLCEPDRLRVDPVEAAASCDVFAGILPEDKFRLVRSLQGRGHTVGMTGDGVNDAPALKQAEVGIAVANATDVAKAAASIVLMRPGLAGIVTTIEASRRIYQRMFTYTLNRILKSFEVALFLSLALAITGQIVITPLLIVLLLFANDFVTMSLATDHVRASPSPDRWAIQPLLQVGFAMAAMIMAVELLVFLWNARYLPLAQLRTLVFLLLVFTSQGAVYLVRERGHFWKSIPSCWMLLASVLDLLVVSSWAIGGILMAPLPAALVGETFCIVAAALAGLDFAKVAIFRLFGGNRVAPAGIEPALPP
ncbi:MAG: HAD-IC family P-type ATPase, partial [Cyanobacteria bacterium REEB65]|nr:HAD-IC family P-type ATPase [Cyanobacteria bacterium REEB65]